MSPGTESDTYHPWSTYIDSVREARRRWDRRVGTEHILLGLLHERDIEDFLGVDLDQARDCLDRIDNDALGILGIAIGGGDLPPAQDAPRKPTIRAVLAERLPMTPAAKKVLEQAGRPMRRGKLITPREVLARLLALPVHDPCSELMDRLEIDREAVVSRLALGKL